MQNTIISTNRITTKPLCPVCKGVCGVEVAPGDWFDCDRCDATGRIEPGRVIYTDRASLPKWDARFLELAEHFAGLARVCRRSGKNFYRTWRRMLVHV